METTQTNIFCDEILDVIADPQRLLSEKLSAEFQSRISAIFDDYLIMINNWPPEYLQFEDDVNTKINNVIKNARYDIAETVRIKHDVICKIIKET